MYQHIDLSKHCCMGRPFRSAATASTTSAAESSRTLSRESCHSRFIWGPPLAMYAVCFVAAYDYIYVMPVLSEMHDDNAAHRTQRRLAILLAVGGRIHGCSRMNKFTTEQRTD